jgi:hypothetical protein
MTNECHQTLTPNVIGHAFGIEASRLQRICSKAGKKPKPPFWPPALDEDQTASILAFIRSGYSAHNYVRQRGIFSFIEGNYGKSLTYQWMASFLKSHDRLMVDQSFDPRRT